MLEAGFEERGRPCVLLLHGFPEIAYSWRKIMPPLAAAGFHVVAPDQRGYGRTTGWSADYDGDLRPFRILNAVRDALGLVSALGHPTVAAVVGHDFGASVAAWCALVRPDVFRSVALMSAPFAGPPALPFDTADGAAAGRGAGPDIHAGIGRARPAAQALPMVLFDAAGQRRDVALPAGRPRLPARLFPLQERRLAGQPAAPARSRGRAGELAKMPTYYIMDLDRNMADDGSAGDAVGGRDRRLPMAARAPSSRSMPANTAAQRLPGRAQLVSLAHRRALRSRTAAILRPHDRRAVDLHRRQQRLGHLPAPRRFRAHAGHRLHPDDRRAI